MGSAGEQLKHDPLGAIVNGFSNFATIGTFGYNKDEGFTKKQGANLHMWDEGIGEITGRNVQRQGIAEADARVTAAAATAAQEQADARAKAAMADVQASDSAAAARTGARESGGSGGPRGVMGQTLGGGKNTDDDFLGL